jgi:hypothetical protein
MSAACGVSSRLPQRDSRPITLLSLPLDGCFRKGHNIIRVKIPSRIGPWGPSQ